MPNRRGTLSVARVLGSTLRRHAAKASDKAVRTALQGGLVGVGATFRSVEVEAEVGIGQVEVAEVAWC